MTKKRKLPSPRVLRRLLDYDPETGELRWKERPAWLFKKHHRNGSRRSRAGIWNSRYANQPAFTAVDHRGYREGKLLDKVHRGHRVIWAIYHGQWPDEMIDHQNGDRLDNRIQNLRVVDHAQNTRNKKKSAKNKSGVIGVCWDSSRQKWAAYIHAEARRKKHLGRFDNFDDAVAARKSAEKKFSYHKNHGRD